MFAHDRGWLRRMKEAIQRGMTAEAAVERVQNDTRARMLRQADAYWRERLQATSTSCPTGCCASWPGDPRASRCRADLPHDTVLVARTMGPADLLDYDRSRLRGLVIEDSGGQSHVAIVAKALGIAGRRPGARRHRAGRSGQSHHRRCRERRGPHPAERRRHRRLRRQGPLSRPAPAQVPRFARQARRHQGRPAHRAAHQCRTADGHSASGRVGRRRHRSVPHRAAVHGVGDAAAARAADPDVPHGGRARRAASRWCFAPSTSAATRSLPYLRQPEEENPALGWRAIRLALDRPVLLRTQVRALLRATAGHELRLLLPMVTTVGEVDMARALVDRELELMRRRGAR